MDTNIFKDKISELLSSTGFSLNLRRDKFRPLKSKNDLKPVLEFIENNLSSANCVTFDELQKFQEINRARSKNDDSFQNEVETNTLQEFYTKPEEQLFSFSSLFLDDMVEEVNHAKTRLQTKESLKSMISQENNSEVASSMIQLIERLDEAKIEDERVLSELYSVNKELGKSLLLMSELSVDLQKSLSSLVTHTDISADDGIDTMPDKPTLFSSTWSLSSTCSSLDSTASHRVSNEKTLFCQMNLMNLEKDRKRYEDRILSLWPELNKIANFSNNMGVDLKLKFKTILERLSDSRFRLIKCSMNKIGSTETRRKIKNLRTKVKNGEWKPSLSEIRCEIDTLKLQEYDKDLNEEYSSLMDSCKEWSVLLMLKPSCDYLQRSIEFSGLLTNKMDKINKLLSTKVITDAVLKALIHEEVDMLERSTKSNETVHERVSRIVDNTSQRIVTMNRNLTEFNSYSSQPPEERCGLVRTLANVLRTEPRGVEEAIDRLDQESLARHDWMMRHCDHHIKTLFTIHDQMKDLMVEGLRAKSGPDNAFLNQLDRTKNALQDLRREVDDVNLQCTMSKEDNLQ